MAKKKSEKKTCGDCIHEYACSMWNVGSLHNTDASNCVNHEKFDDIALIGWHNAAVEKPTVCVGDKGYTGYLVFVNGYYEVADYNGEFHVDGEYEPCVAFWMQIPKAPRGQGDSMTYYEAYRLSKTVEELRSKMIEDIKVATYIIRNPDRVKAIQDAGSRVAREKGWL